MGCDIHGWVEIKENDKWIAFKELKSRERNYDRFTELASVRGDSNKNPLGKPKDCSETVDFWIRNWDSDGHSHSYMELQEAALIFFNTERGEINNYIKKYSESHFFDVERETYKEGSEFRLVFWFDN